MNVDELPLDQQHLVNTVTARLADGVDDARVARHARFRIEGLGFAAPPPSAYAAVVNARSTSTTTTTPSTPSSWKRERYCGRSRSVTR